MMANRYAPIEDYGIIGDLHTVALVGMNGSIDFLCLPSFDSPSVFAALLDAERGGRFQIAPQLDDAVHKQLYLPDTNVLLTRFLSDSGVAEVSDFMPVEDAGVAHNLVRRAKTVRGEVRFAMRCEPRFDYGRATHTVERRSDTEILFVGRSGARELALRLRSSVPMQIEDGAADGRSSRSAPTQSASFVLEVVIGDEPSPCAQPDYVSDAFKETVNFWRGWIGRSTYKGRWREMVNRSALTLKLLTSQRARLDRRRADVRSARDDRRRAQLGLPLHLDPRLVVHALRPHAARLHGRGGGVHALDRGALRGARAGRLAPDHVRHRRPSRAPRGDAAPPRGLHGLASGAHRQRRLRPASARHLRRADGLGLPVRQVRLADLARRLDERRPADRLGVRELAAAGRGHLGGARRAPRVPLLARDVLGGDRPRHPPREQALVPGAARRWYETRDTIYSDIYERFWDPARRGFVQHPGAATFDAAALLMPLVRFISPTDPRWLSTLRGIEQELVSDSLVYRYRLGERFSDGLTGQEGTFSMCSFWYVECLSRMGDLQKARFFFEKMLGYANHLGLYGEELGPRAQHLGNFPQAFTHLALISAAYDLDRRLSAAGHAG